MWSHRLTWGSFSQALFWFTSLAVTLVSAPWAWSQDTAVEPGKETKVPAKIERDGPSTTDGSSKDKMPASAPSEADQRAVRRWLELQSRMGRGHAARHPAHEMMLIEAKAEIEVLEAQIEAKRAHIGLVDARLKQARTRRDLLNRRGAKSSDDEAKRAELDAEVGVLEAECATERAELKEPEALLKYARRRLEHIEDTAGGMAAMPPSHVLMMGAEPWMGAHPMPMHHMGMQPMDMNVMAEGRMADMDMKLLELREAIQGLEHEVDRLASRSRQ
jgi:hypothetical protein